MTDTEGQGSDLVMRALQTIIGPAIVLLALLLGACGFDDSAADIAKDRLQLTADGKYAEAWDQLHPAQQAVVRKDLFVACGEQAAQEKSPEISDLKVRSEDTTEKEVAEVGTVEVNVVSLEWKVGDELLSAPFDMVKVDDQWRWVLDAETLDSFRNGECPR